MPGDTAERLRRLQERRTRTGPPPLARPQQQPARPPVAPWPPPGAVVVRTAPTSATDAAVHSYDRRRRHRRKQPALITRALIAAASIGTFVLLVTAMGPVRSANDPAGVNDATVPTSASAVVVPGHPGTTVLSVGDIGEMSASLHHRSAPMSPSTTGR